MRRVVRFNLPYDKERTEMEPMTWRPHHNVIRGSLSALATAFGDNLAIREAFNESRIEAVEMFNGDEVRGSYLGFPVRRNV